MCHPIWLLVNSKPLHILCYIFLYIYIHTSILRSIWANWTRQGTSWTGHQSQRSRLSFTLTFTHEGSYGKLSQCLWTLQGNQGALRKPMQTCGETSRQTSSQWTGFKSELPYCKRQHYKPNIHFKLKSIMFFWFSTYKYEQKFMYSLALKKDAYKT